MKKNKLNEKMINPQPEPPGSYGMINPQPEPPGSYGMINPQPEPSKPQSKLEKVGINPQPEPPKPQSKLEKVGINPQPEPPKPAALLRNLKIGIFIGLGVAAIAIISYFIYKSQQSPFHG